jgi:hypothetical protein
MPDDKVHIAVLPDPLQFDNIDRKCPYANATIRTVNGLGFQVHCNREPFSLQAGYILTPGSSINGTAIPANVHTDSFDDCMQFCATMRPTCYGVSFFPRKWANCFPLLRGVADVRHMSASNRSHVALAQLESLDTSCAGGTTFAGAGDTRTTFDVSCDNSANGTFTSSVFTQSLPE